MGSGDANASEVTEQQKNAEIELMTKYRDAMADKIEDKEKALEEVKSQRKAAFNPYADLTNEFANLGVATQAAEFQAEQTDIALASTLDAMKSSGAGAGGATALAQAALMSKRGISANLQQQEAANQKAAAQGAANVQKAKAEGEKYKFSIEEDRNKADLNRAAKDLDNQNARVDAAQAGLMEQQLYNTEIS